MDQKPPSYNPQYKPEHEPPPPYQAHPSPTVVHGYTTTSTGSTTYFHPQQQPTYGSVPIIVQPVRATDVIVVGGCPACRVGVLNEEFTLPGLCCAFWFFPLGLLCCLLMRERRCSNCRATFN